MAYVIGQACIGTKDTACIGVCPTDSIHGYEESNQLFIDPVTCIDCDACAQACPVSAIFPGDQVPADQQKFTSINADFFKSWDRSKSIANTKKPLEVPGSSALAEGVDVSDPNDATWKEVDHWQDEWKEHELDQDDPIEVQKRYGRVRSVFETTDRYVIRFFLPEKTPNHPYVYRYNLPREVSNYAFKASAEGNVLKVSAILADAKLAKLSGLVNSFPDRFYLELPMQVPVEQVSIENKSKHVVDVVVSKRVI